MPRGDLMDLRIRPAERDDAPFMVPLVNDADGGMPLAIWTSLAQPGESPWDVGLRRVQSDDTPVSWSMGWIAEGAGTPVGVLIVHQLVRQPGFPLGLISLSPPVGAGPAHPEVPAGSTDVPADLGML